MSAVQATPATEDRSGIFFFNLQMPLAFVTMASTADIRIELLIVAGIERFIPISRHPMSCRWIHTSIVTWDATRILISFWVSLVLLRRSTAVVSIPRVFGRPRSIPQRQHMEMYGVWSVIFSDPRSLKKCD